MQHEHERRARFPPRAAVIAQAADGDEHGFARFHASVGLRKDAIITGCRTVRPGRRRRLCYEAQGSDGAIMTVFSLGERKVKFHGEEWFIAHNATVVGSVVIHNQVSGA